MKVREYLKNKLHQGAVHITLIDPVRQPPEAAGRLAVTAQEVGSDLIFIGGSSGVTQRGLMETMKVIKRRANIPVIFSHNGNPCLTDAFHF